MHVAGFMNSRLSPRPSHLSLQSSVFSRLSPIVTIGIIKNLSRLKISSNPRLDWLEIGTIFHFPSKLIRIIFTHREIFSAKVVAGFNLVDWLKFRAREHFTNGKAVFSAIEHAISNLLVDRWVVNQGWSRCRLWILWTVTSSGSWHGRLGLTIAYTVRLNSALIVIFVVVFLSTRRLIRIVSDGSILWLVVRYGINLLNTNSLILISWRISGSDRWTLQILSFLLVSLHLGVLLQKREPSRNCISSIEIKKINFHDYW